MSDVAATTDQVSMDNDRLPAQNPDDNTVTNDSESVKAEWEHFKSILNQYRHGDVHDEWKKLEDQLQLKTASEIDEEFKIRYPNFFDDKEILTLYTASGLEAKFVVNNTANVKAAKKLFSTEASNPYSDMLYAEFKNDDGFLERPDPMAGGRYIPEGVLSIVNDRVGKIGEDDHDDSDDGDKSKQLADDVLLADASWVLSAYVKDLNNCLPELCRGEMRILKYCDEEKKEKDVTIDVSKEPHIWDLILHEVLFTLYSTGFKQSDFLKRFVEFGELSRIHRRCSPGDRLDPIEKLVNSLKERLTKEELADMVVFYLESETLVKTFEIRLRDFEDFTLHNHPFTRLLGYEERVFYPADDDMHSILKILERSVHSLSESQQLRVARSLERYCCGMFRICGNFNLEYSTPREQTIRFKLKDVPCDENLLRVDEILKDEIDRSAVLEEYLYISERLGKNYDIFSIPRIKSRLSETRLLSLAGEYDIIDKSSNTYLLKRVNGNFSIDADPWIESILSYNDFEAYKSMQTDALKKIEEVSHRVLTEVFGEGIPRIALSRSSDVVKTDNSNRVTAWSSRLEEQMFGATMATWKAIIQVDDNGAHEERTEQSAAASESKSSASVGEKSIDGENSSEGGDRKRQRKE